MPPDDPILEALRSTRQLPQARLFGASAEASRYPERVPERLSIRRATAQDDRYFSLWDSLRAAAAQDPDLARVREASDAYKAIEEEVFGGMPGFMKTDPRVGALIHMESSMRAGEEAIPAVYGVPAPARDPGSKTGVDFYSPDSGPYNPGNLAMAMIEPGQWQGPANELNQRMLAARARRDSISAAQTARMHERIRSEVSARQATQDSIMAARVAEAEGRENRVRWLGKALGLGDSILDALLPGG